MAKAKKNDTAAADALRNNMDAAEYKHVVLGLIFLKYISDAFDAKHAELISKKADFADPEDPDEYRGHNIFWVPKEARWAQLKANAPQATIGKLVDDAMTAIERDNPSLKGVLPKEYARPGLDKQRLGQIINLVSDVALGSAADRSKDTLGRVYEYFLSRFASAEARAESNFIRPPALCVCWSECWLHTKAVSMIPVAVQVECSSAVRNSSKPMVERSAIFPFTGRNQITQPGAWQR